MPNRRFLLLLMPLVVACTVDLSMPPAGQVTCNDTSDCSAGSRCVAELGLCSVPGVDDAVPPALVDFDLQPTSGKVGTVFTLRFSVNEPLLVEPVVTDDFEQRWVKQPESTALDYVYKFTAAFGVPDGALSVNVRLVDHGGNLERTIAGSIIVDTEGPDIYPARLTVVSSPPGTDDTLAGGPESTEGGATLELFADAELTTSVVKFTANDEGGFEPVSLGDNHVDELLGESTGQAWYWLRATDALGNHGPSMRITTDVRAPVVEVLAIERRATSPLDGALSWVESTRFRATPDDETGRVRVLIAGQLVALPRLRVGEVVDVACALVDLGHEGGTYECPFAPPSDVDEGASLEVLVFAQAFGAGNVGAARAGPVSIDATLPPAPAADRVSVVMSPTGEDDMLVLEAGAVEPLATVVAFEVRTVIGPSGAACELVTHATARADETGAVTISLGDNQVNAFEVRQVDAAGNDPCPVCFGGGCGASVPLANDTFGPQVQVQSTVPAFTSSTDATLSLQVEELGPSVGDGEPMLVHPPVTLECWLDGAPLSCDAEVRLAELSAALHRFEYRGVDALGNASQVGSFEWTVQPVALVVDEELRAPLTHRSYVIDEAGLGHLFVGGKALYAFHEHAGGGFTSEVVVDRRVVSVVAARHGSTTWVAYQYPGERNQGADVMLARNDGTGWTTQLVTQVVTPLDELELVIDGGEPVVFVLRCRKPSDRCFTSGADNGAFALEAHRFTQGQPGVEVVPGTQFARLPRAVSDGQGHLWLLHAETEGRGTPVLLLNQRSEGVWQTAVTVAGEGAPHMGSSGSLFPGLALGPGGLPVVSYSPDINQPIWSAAYTGTGFTFHNHNRTGAHIALSGADGVIREVFGAWDVPVHERSAQGVWTQSTLSFPHHPSAVAAAQQDGALHVVVSRGDSHSPLERVSTNGVTQVAPADGYVGFAPVVGSQTPTLVVAASGELTLRAFDGAVWAQTETIRSLPTGMGSSPSAAADSVATWVAHLDVAEEEVWVEHRDSEGWHSVGPLNHSSHRPKKPVLSLRADGRPLVVYQDSNRLYGTWWDGAAFGTPIELHALNGSNDLTNLQVVGDHEGLTWVIFGDSNHQKVRAVRFDTTQATPLSCEGCGLMDIVPVTGTPYVSAAVSPAGALQVMVSSLYDTFSLSTYDQGAWSSTSLNGLLSGFKRGAPGEGWLPVENDCFASGPVVPQQTTAFGFDGQGRMVIQAKVDCYRWSQGNGLIEMLAVETSPGAFSAYPLATAGDGWVEFSRAVLPSGNGAVVVWGNPAEAQVASFATENL